MSSKYNSKLKGQRVLVLGGTSGIGFSVAEGAVEQGATVFISGSQQAKLENKIQELKKSYPDAQDRIFGKTCDVSQPDAQETNIVALLDFATENNTKMLNHIAFTAGAGYSNAPFSELTHDIINEALKMRAFAPLILTKHVETYLEKSNNSSLTFTSGQGTYKPPKGYTMLIMIGGMLDALTRAAAVNLAPIRVNCVAPGAVLTELWGGGNKPSEEQAKEVTARFQESVLTGKVGLPEDVAEAYLYFMKDRNVTGRNHATEGGFLLK